LIDPTFCSRGHVGPLRVEPGRCLEKAIVVAPASFDMYVRNRVPWMQPDAISSRIRAVADAIG
jgi:hypothetical protein